MDKIDFIKKDIYNLECSVNGKLRNHNVELVTEWAYGFYGDVVVFNTTFNTNRYDLTFAPILHVKLKLLKDGPRRSKRVTGAKEKAMKRGIRHCRECGHIGHGRRHCPRNLNTP
ncbi:hypothetical protein L3X38_011866 [Prunus dulcis]|uniref:CCHC-type domain-containing protein n=1 Tax=Prunus dulcis TaxID=3755 RepID=A0AAD4ZFI7_PRUDU|nr:hypothetical protein L3X38_011866 [Prunus dulcis]